MSPEQAGEDSDSVDTRADVYALGVLLFELLAGALPLDLTGMSVPAAVLTIIHEPPRRLSQVRPGLDGDLETITAKALMKDPEARYASCQSLASDITRFLLNEPIVARPPSLRYLVRKFAHRNRTIVSVVLVGLFFIAVSMVSLVLALSHALKAQAEADRNLAEVRRFSDQLLARELIEKVHGLFPREPRLSMGYKAWLDDAKILLEARGQHQAFYDSMQDIPGDDLDSRWRATQAAAILAALDELEPLAKQVQSHYEFTLEVEHLTIEEPAEDWVRAAESLRADDRTAHIELTPQLGLVPLEADPETGFFEFWMPGTGKRPRRGPEQRWVIEPDTGIVLILLPGGTVSMGAEPPSPGKPVGSPFVDRDASAKEIPVHEVQLDPFFLSKYELTQGQWAVIHSSNPSVYSAKRKPNGIPRFATGANPVEAVSWHDAAEGCRRLGLMLPTEAQWEYAARGGSTTRWWTGDEIHSLQGAENLADQRSLQYFIDIEDEPAWGFIPGIEDDWIHHAPVGRMTPNPFGFHDTLGNVAEWVRDPYSEYEFPAEPGTGYRSGDKVRDLRVRRGGSYRSPLLISHVAHRMHWTPNNLSGQLGLRPSRPLK